MSGEGQAARIVAAVYGACPYLNAARGNTDLKITANGHTVG